MKKLSGMELLAYYLMVISSLGMVWLYKIIIKKALLDAENEKKV